ncbi:MAG TPA: hypothetical protein V6D33_06045, partial [Cyanophyceae cyanobacterium]
YCIQWLSSLYRAAEASEDYYRVRFYQYSISVQIINLNFLFLLAYLFQLSEIYSNSHCHEVQ